MIMETFYTETREHSNDLSFSPDRDNVSDEPDRTDKNGSIDGDPLLGPPQCRHTINTDVPPGIRSRGIACLGGSGFYKPGRNASVRSEIENKLLEEICESRRDPLPGLFERHRRNFQGKPAMSFWSEESPPVPLSLPVGTSPLLSKINAHYTHRRGSVESEAEEETAGEDLVQARPRRKRGKRPKKKRRRALPPGIDQLQDPLISLETRTCRGKGDGRSGNPPENRKRLNHGELMNCVVSEKGIKDVKGVSGLPTGGSGDLQTPDGSSMDGPYSSCGEDSPVEVLRRIRSYNRSMSLEAFHIKTAAEEHRGEFQGALRFYFESGQHQVSKALKLRSTTTVGQLLPLVVDKFNLTPHLEGAGHISSQVGIFQRRPDGEIPLEDEGRPLSLALTSRCRPRFVVRLTRTQEETADVLMSDPAPRGPDSREERPRRHGHRRKSKHRKHEDNMSVDGYEFGEAAQVGDYRTGCYESDGGVDASIMNITTRREGSSRSSRGRRRREKKEGHTRDKEGHKRESSLDRISSQLSLRKGSLRLTRSMTNLVQKTFSLRQKDSPFRQRPELSTEDSAPGVLKVFGSSISPGAEYKSVLATPSSTARELVKEALERYNISRRQARHYVLCDVIGRFVVHTDPGTLPEVVRHAPRTCRSAAEGVWVEECVRIVGDNERPLTIQTFWKPSQEHSRRFEIRKRSDMVTSVDTVTCGINANARRMLLTKTRLHAVPGLVGPHPQVITKPELADESFMSITDNQVDSMTQVNLPASPPRTGTPPLGDKRPHLRAPVSHPYLLTLRGRDSDRDSLIYVLHERVTMVGSGPGQMGDGDICLTAPDVLPEHCWLSQSMDQATGATSTALDPLPDAPVRINDRLVDGTVTLGAGDVVYIGEHYAFLYKPPREADQSGELDLTNVRQSLQDPTLPGVEDCEPSNMLKWRKDRSELFDADGSRLRLAYLREKEDALLDSIVSIMDKHPHAPKLTTAYLTCMCMEHSISKFGAASARDLISKLSNLIQVTVWEATKVLADTQANVKNDRQTHIEDLLPDLQPVILWLSNAVELHYFFRRSVRDSLRKIGPPDKTNSGEASPEEEIVVVLEDVVMYSFQQTVYYLTKALYPILPAILDGNPFSTDSLTSAGEGPPGSAPTVEGLVGILQTTLSALSHLQLHAHILSQLFCYLFFFTSTSLFNMLMAKGTKYYKWSRGVRIRGNLDAIEAWAAASGLGEEAAIYLSKINTLANLLATPRLQLLTANWQGLRRDFPELNGEQLLKVLTEYDLGPHQEQPENWAPPEGAVDTATWSSMLTESFSDHPPLRLPKTGFRIDLNQPSPDEELCDVIHRLTAEFGLSDDDGDSGLSVSQTLPVFTDIPQSPVYIAGSGDDSGRPFDDSALDLPPYPRLPSPVACRAGTLDCSSATCPVPPKRRSRHERHKVSVRHGENLSDGTCDTSTTAGSKVPEPDLGDSGISMSGEQKDMRAEEHRLIKLEFEGPTSNHTNSDKCNASQVSSCSGSSVRRPDRKLRRNHSPNRRSGRGGSVSPPRYRDHTKPPDQLTTDLTCTGPLAMSSPVSSDSTPCPSPVSQIPPQPTTPAPTLDRASLKRRTRAGSRRDRSPAEADDTKVVEVNYLLPTTPDGVVNGLRVLPLPAELPTTNGEGDPSQQTDFLRTIQAKIETEDSLDVQQPEERAEEEEEEEEEEVEDVFVVDLVKGDRGLGLGLIDGMFTPLRRPGIYVRTLVPSEPAAVDGRLQIGDRILAVNGQSVVGADYQSAMKTIREGGQFLQFLVAQGNRMITMQITASSC